MFSLDDVCLLCHTNSKNLTNILSEDGDGVVIEKKLKFFLFELVQNNLAISKQICMNCLKNLNFVYKFKHMCLRNIMMFNNNIHTFGNEEKSSENKITVKTQNTTSTTLEKINDTVPTKIIKLIPCSQIQNINLKNDLPLLNNQIIKVNKNTNQDIAIDKKFNQIITVGEKTVINEPVCDETSEETVEQETMDLNQVKDVLETESINSKEPNKISLLESILQNKTQTSSTNHHAKKYKCNICDIRFRYLQCLTEHNEILHVAKEPYDCNLCNEKFINLTELKTHKDQHDYNSPLECKFCKKTLIGKYNYDRHIKNAHNKVHVCDICEKGFRDKSSLNSHMRGHTGEKPFSCDVCDRKFRIKILLRKHKETHMNKQYKCNLCSCQYDKKFGLTQHKRLVHAIKKKTI